MNNPYVIEKVMNIMNEIGIKIYHGYQMFEWNENNWKSGEIIDTICFKKISSDRETDSMLEVPCCVSI